MSTIWSWLKKPKTLAFLTTVLLLVASMIWANTITPVLALIALGITAALDIWESRDAS